MPNNVESQTHDEHEIEYKLEQYKSKLTMNNFGKMSLSETPHFTLLKKMADKSKPILDIGCAYGFTSKALLASDFQVIANDLSNDHLVNGFKDISDEHRSRLTLKPCSMLELDFEENSLSGIVALNVVHFLMGTDVREMFKRFYKWLAPGGILTVSGASPYLIAHIMLDPVLGLTHTKQYYDKLGSGIEWPGETLINFKEIASKMIWSQKLVKNLPKDPHWLSTEILAREASLAHFNIFKLDYFNEDHEGYSEIKENANKLFASILCVKEAF